MIEFFDKDWFLLKYAYFILKYKYRFFLSLLLSVVVILMAITYIITRRGFFEFLLLTLVFIYFVFPIIWQGFLDYEYFIIFTDIIKEINFI